MEKIGQLEKKKLSNLVAANRQYDEDGNNDLKKFGLFRIGAIPTTRQYDEDGNAATRTAIKMLFSYHLSARKGALSAPDFTFGDHFTECIRLLKESVATARTRLVADPGAVGYTRMEHFTQITYLYEKHDDRHPEVVL